MAKKITLATLAANIARIGTRMENGFAGVEARFDKLEARLERGFAATADDLADVRRDMASAGEIIALHGQVNAIQADIRTMKQGKLEARVADLEDELFGTSEARTA